VVISQHARGHILTLIESLLMPDTSASRVYLMHLPLLTDINNIFNYSWGATVLTCLYRALNHGIDFNQTNIGGCMLLLQSWAWYRITSITPLLTRLVMKILKQDMTFHWLRDYLLCPSQCIISLIYIYFLKKSIILHYKWSCPAQRTNILTYALHLLQSTFDQCNQRRSFLIFTIT